MQTQTTTETITVPMSDITRGQIAELAVSMGLSFNDFCAACVLYGAAAVAQGLIPKSTRREIDRLLDEGTA